MALLFGLLLGILQGFRHAFEPDHVVAVSTMIAEARTARARIAYASAWGLGHAAMLLAIGMGLMLARARLPARIDAAFGVAVAMMLVAVGARAIVLAARWSGHRSGEPPTAPSWRAFGPLAMGMVHGLAGSGALMALVMARLPSALLGVLFMALFGAGATLGMSLLAMFAGLPLARAARMRWGLPALLGGTGLLSLGLGLSWIGPAMRGLLGAS